MEVSEQQFKWEVTRLQVEQGCCCVEAEAAAAAATTTTSSSST
jgi:hypothetical protein